LIDITKWLIPGLWSSSEGVCKTVTDLLNELKGISKDMEEQVATHVFKIMEAKKRDDEEINSHQNENLVVKIFGILKPKIAMEYLIINVFPGIGLKRGGAKVSDIIELLPAMKKETIIFLKEYIPAITNTIIQGLKKNRKKLKNTGDDHIGGITSGVTLVEDDEDEEEALDVAIKLLFPKLKLNENKEIQ
jgi:predicted CopG family antitoxin